MADEQKPAAAPATPAAPAPAAATAPAGDKLQVNLDPEKNLKERIPQLEEKVKKLRQDLKIMQGRVTNKNKISPAALQKDKAALAEDVTLLKKIVYELELRLEVARDPAESQRWGESIRDSAAEYCKKENIEIQW